MHADGFPDAPPETVAHHRAPQGARHGEAHARPVTRLPAQAEGREIRPGKPGTAVVNASEILGTQQANTFWKTGDGNYLSELTVSFLRPRARRREMTARPSWVFIRVRNPCVLARLRLFG
jgi:hypothetical protein